MDSTCVLCGAPISYSSAQRWLREFRAIYVEDNQWGTVKISGVGLAGEDEYDAVCPEHQHQRYDDEGLDPDSTIYIHLSRATLDPKPAHGLPPLSFAGFGFHSACWEILTMIFRPDPRRLFQLCLSMPSGSADILDWGHDYGGAALYSTTDPVPTITRRSLAAAPRGAVYQANPLESIELRHATGRVPRLEANSTALSPGSTTDNFARLPPEILEHVFNYLPSCDVANARLASRTFASVILSEGFWASRFRQGFEFQHIFEVSSIPPQSWRTLYAILRNGAESAPGLDNRRRIWGLGQKVQSLYNQMIQSPCHGSSVATLFEPSLPKDTGSWHLAKASLEPPTSTTFRYGCRPLRSRLIESSSPINTSQTFVSFVLINESRFISGMRFVAEDGSSHRLGYIHPAVEESISLPAQSSIQEWCFAVDVAGIKAIAVRPTDATLSPWVGERGNLPLWHLSTSSDIHRIKAEFDTLKLVSFGFETPENVPDDILFRDSCLWAPDIPPTATRYDLMGDNTPPKTFSIPFTTAFFGGSHNPDPSTLTQVVAYTFDSDLLTGLEFLHTDSTHDVLLGRRGPFGDDFPKNRCNIPSEDRRIPFSIDGPGGERITAIQLEVSCRDIQGLKIETDFGRVHSTNSISDPGEKWIRVGPSGSTIIGIFTISDHYIRDIGLLSMDDNDLLDETL